MDATVIASATHRDEEAAWAGHKRRKASHGFKAHVAADADTVLVEGLTVTPANVNDGRAGDEVRPDDPGDLYADSASRGTAFASAVQSQGGSPRVVQTGVWGRPGAMPYASFGRGTIMSPMCAAGSRRSLGDDACAGWDWRKLPCG
ncbi:transposase [Microvirga sp. TS319]|uniref:transposase n=1 Tax=Microvirga sp. TS319 TaxID=3241165 RepID=UPI00351A1B69